jgi:hypothetical protein
LAGPGADDHAALLVDGVERAFDRGARRLDRNRLPEAGRAVEPEPSDLAEAAAVVPDAEEVDPTV